MKRSNHNQKKGAAPIIARCGLCNAPFTSKYQEKNHVCRER